MEPSVTRFETFFALGKPIEASPFLRKGEGKVGQYLDLKVSILSACLLATAWGISWVPSLAPLSHILLLLVYFLSGTPALINALEDLSLLNVNIDVLMTLAAFSSIFIGGAYEGGLLLVLFALSGSLEEMVSSKAKDAIEELKTLSPQKALVIEDDGKLIERAVGEVPVGKSILVRAGEYVPLDGEILEGRSLLNLSHLTGESEPVPKGVGESVPSGALTVDGTLTLKVTHSVIDSTLSKIIQLVTEAEEKKPRLEKWFDKFSNRYATTIIAIAALTALIYPLFGLPFLGREGSVYRALAFLIAASPCALIIALPTAYLSAISSAAKKGILLKGGAILEAIARAKSIALDKTGTLTTGELEIVFVKTLGFFSEDEAIRQAASLEQGAKHPLGLAIIRYAKKKEISFPQAEEVKLLPGYGIEGKVDGTFSYIGNFEWILPSLSEETKKIIESERQQGKSLAVLKTGDNLAIFTFQDRVRSSALQVIEKLKSDLHLKTYILTGDHPGSGKKVQQQLGIDHLFADLRPDDKLYHVSRLSDNDGLIMVGDGVNDAPALARASVGVAMGGIGSGAALDAADVVLLKDELLDLTWLIEKSRKTKTVIRENLVIALSAIVLASTPALLGYVPLWLAVILHEGGTLLVGLNALRLLKR